MQSAVEQVLYGGMKLLNARGAAAILMDVHTGEVVSIASLPDFDPNHRPRPPVQGQAADSPSLIVLFRVFMNWAQPLKFLRSRRPWIWGF